MVSWNEIITGSILFGELLPPGSYVNGLPITQFEGLMRNRLSTAIYSITTSDIYNHRAVSNLDSETMVSMFQELDPKGSGVPKQDIMVALGTAASFITNSM